MQSYRQRLALRSMMTNNLLAQFSGASATALAKVDEYRNRGAMVNSVSAQRVVLSHHGMVIEIDARGQVTQRKT